MKNNMRIFAAVVFALCVSLFAMSAMAQTTTTGSIEGSVVDANGAAVPGVTVLVKSPNLISAQSATTDGNGRFRVLNLPPGKYTIKIEETGGFAAYEQANIEVNLSKTANLTATLQPKGTVVSVDITDTSAVDTAGNTGGTNVSTEQFSNFPTQRTVQSLYTIAPSVARSGLRDASGRDRDPSVGGSSGPENNYILDGVNTTDPAFGGSGANLPFEFVQEVEIKTGAFGAEYGKSTGGIFNVITKSGSNEFHGDAFGYFTTKGLVRSTKNFPFVGSAPDGFSEIDAGVDIGGPIKKDKVWFFAAFNPQQRKNGFLTQNFRIPVENKITTPFYSGKLTFAINQNHTFTFSTFGDFTKQTGFLFGGSGFGNDLSAFRGQVETGGHNYAARLNSQFSPTFTGEFAFGLHYQRANVLPESATTTEFLLNSFAVISAAGTRIAPTSTNVVVSAGTGFGDFVNGTGGLLARNFVDGPGFGLFSTQDRNRWEVQARLQNIWGPHTVKYGFEFNRNIYKINTISTGTARNFNPGPVAVNSSRVTNNFGVCIIVGLVINCPADALRLRIQALITAGVPLGGPTSVVLNPAIIASVGAAGSNPFLIRTSTRVRDFRLQAPTTETDVEGFYIQDDFKIAKNVQFNFGLRWDYQQAYGEGGVDYLKLNSFKDNLQPRVGLIWDFTGKGKGKLYLNYARYLETPIPLDVNVRAGSDTTQTDLNFNVSTLNALANTAGGGPSLVVADFGNLGATATPIDFDLKPQTVNEYAGGIEYEIVKDMTLGVRGVYRPQGSVIEDGSFDDGGTYFLFNPGESETERLACADPTIGCFGRARRYYRAVEFTATKRFTNNYQFIISYVYSSLIGNYEGLFRNDNGQSDPNITSLFDLVSLLGNSYGRLPNDRPHQFKFDGSYRFPFKLLVGGSFRAQSGIPFNQLIPHPVYGNNEGFGVIRGTAIVPTVAATSAGFPNVVNSIGSTRTPTTMNLDLNAYYPIQLGEKKQLRLQVDWFNVFNAQRAIRLDETFQINSGIAGVANIPANRLPNPFYGAGTIFQFPSALRLGIKFQF